MSSQRISLQDSPDLAHPRSPPNTYLIEIPITQYHQKKDEPYNTYPTVNLLDANQQGLSHRFLI